MPENDDNFLWKAVPFEEAAALIEGKGVMSRRIFDDLLPELQASAFIITKVDDLDLVQSIRGRVADLPLGGDWDEIKREITNDLSPWLDTEEDTEAAERRAELLLRSHGFAAYSAANWKSLEANTDIFPYRKYQTAQDERVRGAHAALDGLILPAESPFWASHTPPWEFGCRCDVVGISESELEEILASDKAKARSERQVFERGSSELEMLETRGRILRRGPSGGGGFAEQEVDVTRDPDGFKFRPGDVSLLRNPELLRQRYDSDLWQGFQAWAELQEVSDGRTIWEWLQGARDEIQPPKL